MPASPESNTTWPSPVFAFDQRRSSSSSSSSRPTSSVRPLACRASKRLSTEARSQCRPGSHRPGDALEVLCPEVLKLEQIAEELSRALGNDDAVRLCNALQARRKVRRLAYDGLLLRSARSDQVADDHQSRCDADTGLQGRVGLQATYRSDQLQPCAHGPLCVVLVGLRVAEVDEDAVAHVLRDEAAEALHGLGDALLIGRNDLAEVFRVHARRQRR